MGNHEQLLLLAMTDTSHKERATKMWLSKVVGGSTFFGEMKELSSLYARPPEFRLFSRSLGENILRLFTSQTSHAASGTLILVHAGLDPH
jgi:hypothetical protein